ncbi:MAG TPA: mandelate racemase/muconate lactonizing enzyme family protein [Solirubrobacterales bacterium]|nr:mandelate racemase/muconate lactonizing enzyme family protein [Solirubrobacterales bacterium]
MRIASLEVVPYALPFREPYVTATGTLTRREMVLLRLRSDEGLEGLGEAVPLSLRGGASLARVVEELEGLGALDELDEAMLRDRTTHLSPPARCAALTALVDLRGRRAAAAGSSVVEPVGCNATLVAGDPAAVVSQAERWAADGFSTFKLKLGTGGDAAQVRAVREALGPRARIRIDVNGAWDLETAKRALAEIEPYEIELAEQPVATVEEAVELAASTPIPLAADESVENRADAERVADAGAFAMTGIKLSKVGGPEEALEIAELLPAYVTSALDGPVGIAAALQVAQSLGDLGRGSGESLAHGLATQRLFASTIASVECELRGDLLFPPDGPGLGVEIDEDALQAHRL